MTISLNTSIKKISKALAKLDQELFAFSTCTKPASENTVHRAVSTCLGKLEQELPGTYAALAECGQQSLPQLLTLNTCVANKLMDWLCATNPDLALSLVAEEMLNICDRYTLPINADTYELTATNLLQIIVLTYYNKTYIKLPFEPRTNLKLVVNYDTFQRVARVAMKDCSAAMFNIMRNELQHNQKLCA